MSHNSYPEQPDYQQLYYDLRQRFTEILRENLQLTKYAHALEMDALNAFFDKPKYFEPQNGKVN